MNVAYEQGVIFTGQVHTVLKDVADVTTNVYLISLSLILVAEAVTSEVPLNNFVNLHPAGAKNVYVTDSPVKTL